MAHTYIYTYIDIPTTPTLLPISFTLCVNVSVCVRLFFCWAKHICIIKAQIDWQKSIMLRAVAIIMKNSVNSVDLGNSVQIFVLIEKSELKRRVSVRAWKMTLAPLASATAHFQEYTKDIKLLFFLAFCWIGVYIKCAYWLLNFHIQFTVLGVCVCLNLFFFFFFLYS